MNAASWLCVPSFGRLSKRENNQECKGFNTDWVHISTIANTRTFPAASSFKDNCPIREATFPGTLCTVTGSPAWITSSRGVRENSHIRRGCQLLNVSGSSSNRNQEDLNRIDSYLRRCGLTISWSGQSAYSFMLPFRGRFRNHNANSFIPFSDNPFSHCITGSLSLNRISFRTSESTFPTTSSKRSSPLLLSSLITKNQS